MPIEPIKPKVAPRDRRAGRAREEQEAAVKDVDKTSVEDRDLLHGDGGTLGLDDGEDLNKDD